MQHPLPLGDRRPVSCQRAEQSRDDTELAHAARNLQVIAAQRGVKRFLGIGNVQQGHGVRTIAAAKNPLDAGLEIGIVGGRGRDVEGDAFQAQQNLIARQHCTRGEPDGALDFSFIDQPITDKPSNPC